MSENFTEILKSLGKKLINLFSKNIGSCAKPIIVENMGRLARTRDGLDLLESVKTKWTPYERILVDTILSQMRGVLKDGTTSFLLLLGYALENNERWNEIRQTITEVKNNRSTIVHVGRDNVLKAIRSIVKTELFPELEEVLLDVYQKMSTASSAVKSGNDRFVFLHKAEVPISDRNAIYIHYDPLKYILLLPPNDYYGEEFCIQFEKDDLFVHPASTNIRLVTLGKETGITPDVQEDIGIFFNIKHCKEPIFGRVLKDDGIVYLYRKEKSDTQQLSKPQLSRAEYLMKMHDLRNADTDQYLCDMYRLRAASLAGGYAMAVSIGQHSHEKMMLLEDGFYCVAEMIQHASRTSIACEFAEHGIDVIKNAVGAENIDPTHLDSCKSVDIMLDKLLYIGDFLLDSYYAEETWR